MRGEDYSNFSLFPQQQEGSTTSTGAGSSAVVASSSSSTDPMSGGAGGINPGLFQDPSVMAAVPNPFFGVPNTIDWDEWHQYISNAGLQKF